LQASNENLEIKMTKLRDNTRLLQRELARLQLHITAFQHELLPTWQADILTRLIESAYTIQRQKFPGSVAPWQSRGVDRWMLSRAYSVAAERVSWYTLCRKLGLSMRYYQALQRYGEV
jgi:hypothetical protein